jgi:CysZ protein
MGNGIVFYLFHFIPIIGWILAPTYAVIAATLSIYSLKQEALEQSISKNG